jgi:hypothetical protein
MKNGRRAVLSTQTAGVSPVFHSERTPPRDDRLENGDQLGKSGASSSASGNSVPSS